MTESTRCSAAVKAGRLELVRATRARTDWTIRRILKTLGRTKTRHRYWVKRAACASLADRPRIAACRDGILSEERDSVIAYALAHPMDGYRRLTWQMIDADIAYLSPSSVSWHGDLLPAQHACNDGAGEGRILGSGRGVVHAGASRADGHLPVALTR